MKAVLFNTHDLVLVITVYQCLLFALFLIAFKSGRRISNTLLALFLISHAAISLDVLVWFGAAFHDFIEQNMPNAFFILRIGHWAEAPLLLLYVRSLVYKGPFFRRIHLVYFIPFSIALFDYIFNWFILSPELKQEYLANYSLSTESIESRLVYLFREVFRTYLGVLCLIEIRRYRAHIKNEYADVENIDLRWLKLLVIGFLMIRVSAIVVSLSLISLYELNIPINTEVMGLTGNYVFLFLLSLLIYFSLNSSQVFVGIEPSDESKEEPAPPNTGPADTEVKEIKHYMETQKPYLNNRLRLDTFAEGLSLSARRVSFVINRHYNKNFFEFINGYRIEEAKNLLSDPDQQSLTMLDVMDKVGFNSKATFNTLFKNHVGLTPTQYKKLQLESLSEK